ncbi:MAG TPA: hypothetical protein VGG16_21370 [Streptosporangiaceae bacterium]|jgi:hypothetical protein
MGTEETARSRAIVERLIESKAVDFEAIGRTLAEFGPSAALTMEGDDLFCGTMRRFVNVYRLADVTSELEQLSALREAGRELRA